jgi:phosphohistidine phosphatase SixA
MNSLTKWQTAIATLATFCMALPMSSTALEPTAMLSGPQLLGTLKQGGNVIVMRHASSPRAIPGAATANADNKTPERQLDEAGRNTATAMGKALRDLKIPVSATHSSPTYRALETVKLARLPTPTTHTELGDGGQGMQAASSNQGEWLKKQVTMAARGSNIFVVTHFPVINAAFPANAGGLADGEALVFAADGKGGAAIVARVRIEEWARLGK